ncbi:MAG: cation-translocating P-type ATPase [Planctomycetes bacterium]|nr:cation-translocating P-type ATPase [Planctomycetota bacterium]
MPTPVSTPRGLTAAEARDRLGVEGANELSRDKKRGLFWAVVGVLKEPMLLLLLAAGGIYLILGDRAEALTLLASVLVVIAITLAQEYKTERAVAALRDLSAPRALVLRDGARVRIAGREVVRGDILVLAEGDRVSADARLIEAAHMELDESLLTGESVPVRKLVAEAASTDPRPGGDDQPFVYAGTLVVKGHGLAEVRATGERTEMGRIGVVLAGIEESRTPLQIQVGRIVRIFATLGLAACALLVVVYGITRGNWLEGLLAGIALAMAAMPEEFPVVLTVFMALGAWRLSKHRVLARRLPAVEALGAASVLCADKTGTLTENKMRVARLWRRDARHVVDGSDMPEALREVVEFGVLASQRDPFDPMELAFHQLARSAPSSMRQVREEWTFARHYPLSPALLSVSYAWRAPGQTGATIACKGAPEAVAELCALSAEVLAEYRAEVARMGRDGLRVLGVARATCDRHELPDTQREFEFELIGLVGLEDPLRAGVPDAVAECLQAGVRVVMITGDAPETARAIARQAGLGAEPTVITGKELQSLTDDELRERVRHTSVFARTVPEQKLRLVRALRADGNVVAMTGDGVNDAPALKAAHIGVAMGGRGTDVAREAADLVITDDDFSSIVGAVRLGRRIYDNLRRAMAYIIAVHVPILGLSLLPVFFGWPLVLFPLHIVFLELLIDPACALAFEAEPTGPGAMRRPPRKAGASLFSRHLVIVSLIQGLSLMLVSLAAFRLGLDASGSEDEGRALAFATLIGGNVALIWVNRSWRRSVFSSLFTKNTASWIVVSGATLTLFVVMWVPALAGLFKFGTISAGWLFGGMALGAASLIWFELLKHFKADWLDDS